MLYQGLLERIQEVGIELEEGPERHILYERSPPDMMIAASVIVSL
jgi:hypothetical protein